MPPILCAVVSAVTWGTVHIAGQIAVTRGAAHPVILSLLRFLTASAFLLCAAAVRREIRLPRGADVGHFALLGATGIVGMNVFIFVSLAMTTATAASLLMNANALFIGLFAFAILRERPTRIELAGMAVGFTGCWLIVTRGGPALPGRQTVAGNVFALLSAVCWAAYTVWSKRSGVVSRHGPVAAAFWASLFGTAMLVILAAAMRLPFAASPAALGLGVYLGIVPAGIGFALWYHAIARMKTVVAGLVQFLAPLTTAVLAVALFRDRISAWTIAGGSLVLAGILASVVPAARGTPAR